ncbi:V-set and immunoglobulin domain-containing protein 4 [Tiliqua scincoides]|uniref:V-set and immunoglobulin domain-containing protein 4 n=1 Tax=Tiliqua scincoides TaxID=71010 RepID=UPI003462F6E7
MGMFSWLWLLGLVAIVPGKALLDLNGTLEIDGTWRDSVTLPCVYEPLPELKEVSVVWKIAQQDHGVRTIFHRDATSGDQTLLVSFTGRLSVPRAPPGVVSLQIKVLEMTDAGRYVCEVVWETADKRRLTRERTTTLRVVKVPVTKPVIQFSSNGSVLHEGMNLSLTCLARGSPPLTYWWLKIVPGNAATQLGTDAVLRFEELQLFDAGRYYCEAKNRVGTLQRSNTVQLTVDVPVTKPVIQFSSNESVLQEGMNLSMTCLVRGSPRLTYRWLKIVPMNAATQVGADAVLRFEKLELSDAGRYYCEAKNRVGTLQRSNTVQLTVEETFSSADEEHPEREAPRKASLPLYLVILIAVLCAVLVFTIFAVAFFRRRTKMVNADLQQ